VKTLRRDLMSTYGRANKTRRADDVSLIRQRLGIAGLFGHRDDGFGAGGSGYRLPPGVL